MMKNKLEQFEEDYTARVLRESMIDLHPEADVSHIHEAWSPAARAASAAARRTNGSLNDKKKAARQAFMATRGGKKLLKGRIPEAVKAGFSGKFDKYFWKDIKKSLNPSRSSKAAGRVGGVLDGASARPKHAPASSYLKGRSKRFWKLGKNPTLDKHRLG